MTLVFLSHSTVDKDFVNRLAVDLQQAGIDVWKAPESIPPGMEWVDAIQEGLANSSHLILVKSPAAVESEWVKFEFSVALRREKHNEMVIIPVDYQRVPDEPLFWGMFQKVKVDDYQQGLTALIERIRSETPQNAPAPVPVIPVAPAPPAKPAGGISINIGGNVSGNINVAQGDLYIYDQGRPPAPPPLTMT